MRIGVLGPFEVVVDEAPVPLGGPQPRAVLAVLALRANELVTADALVDALWPDTPPASALGVVRTYVSRLRRALADATPDARVASRPSGYRLEADPAAVDAWCFEQLVGQGREASAAGRSGEAAARFDRALRLWRGDVLADLPWLQTARPVARHLEQRRLDALEGRIEADLELGRHAEVVPELEALTGEHPFRERLWAHLMVALYRTGRQTEALAAYRTVRTLLADELGIEPGPELQELERRVLRQAVDLHVRPPAIPPPLPASLAHPVHEGPLVGREREWAVLVEGLDEARAGHFGAVFLGGPPGIGKTALATAFVRDAWSAGATVLLGRADEDSPAPFHPWRTVIAHWARHCREASGPGLGLGDGDRTVLARIVPELAAESAPLRLGSSGASPEAAATGGDHERQVLFEALGRWAEVASAAAPMVLLLDDLQWADPASLLAVRHLVRHPPPAGVLLLVTYRDVELGTDHPLRHLLAGAHSEGHVRRMGLTGLDQAQVRRLVAATAGLAAAPGEPEDDAVAPTFAAELTRVTGGNPLFVHETVRYLVDQGIVAPQAGRWVTDRPLTAYGIPTGVKEVVEQRLRRLPDTTAAMLRAASVLGEHIELALLARVTDRAVGDVVATVAPAVDARLIHRELGSAGTVAFAHALVREAVLDDLDLPQRARYHWRLGQELLARAPGDEERSLGEAAHHLVAGIAAGRPALAVDATIRAGQQALVTLAFEDAAHRFETAIELLDSHPGADADHAFAAGFALGQAGGALSDRDRQRTGFLRAAAAARAQDRADRLAHAAIGFVDYVNAGSEVPQVDGTRRDQALAQELVDEALARVGPMPSAAHCLLLTHEAGRAVTLGRTAEAAAFADAAVATARQLDDPAAEPFALVARMWSRLGLPCDPELGDAVPRALAFSAPPQHPASLWVFVVPMLPIVAMHLGARVELDAVRARCGADPDLRSSTHLTAYMQMWDGAVALAEGRLADAEHLAATLPGASDSNVWGGVAGLLTIVAAIERGDPTAASQLTDYVALVPDSIASRAMLAGVLAADGEADRAAHQVAAVRARRALAAPGWSTPLVLRHVAEVAARLDDARLATEVLSVATPYGGQMLVSFAGSTVEAAADRAIGQALSVLGRHDEAVARLQAARALEDGFGAEALAARTTYWCARAHLARGAPGDHDAAHRLLGEAARSARRLGLGGLQSDIRSVVTPWT